MTFPDIILIIENHFMLTIIISYLSLFFAVVILAVNIDYNKKVLTVINNIVIIIFITSSILIIISLLLLLIYNLFF